MAMQAMQDDPYCDAINLASATAILDNGDTIPIVAWFDADGEDCEPGEAIVCVAGPCSNGKWYTIEILQFDRATIH